MNSREIMLALIAGLAVLANCGCEGEQAAAPNGNASAQDEDTSHWKVVDEHGDEALTKNNKGEAREWLKDSSHVFFKGDRKKIAQFIEDFYSAGATQVCI